MIGKVGTAIGSLEKTQLQVTKFLRLGNIFILFENMIGPNLRTCTNLILL
jgi:hypothetical protein